MFFDLSFTKLLVLAVIALVVFGPDRLPVRRGQHDLVATGPAEGRDGACGTGKDLEGPHRVEGLEPRESDDDDRTRFHPCQRARLPS